MTRARPIHSLASLLLLSLVACGSSSAPPPPPGVLVQSSLERDLAPQVPQADADELVAGNTAFAADLYGALRQDRDGENLFVSPLSVSMAVAMVYAGARGDTESQIARALHFDLPQERLHRAFNWLDLELSSRGQEASGSDGEAFRLNVVNATFGQTGLEFLPAFLDRLAVNYGAGLSLLDFASDPDGSRQLINDWVAAATEDNITELLPDGVITPHTRLVLTNAVYFNAAWKTQFDPDLTSDGTFHAPDGDISVPMMSGEVEGVMHASGDGFEVITLPYDGDELDMLFLVPDSGRFGEVDESLSPDTLRELLGGLSPSGIGGVTLPSFDFRFKTGLVETMRDMGMTDAFDGDADFSGIDGTRSLLITDIVHEAFVKVTEAGTEAGGATAVVVGEVSIPEWFTIDRPFIFLIRDRETGAVLFLGRVLDPATGS
jgi:serpin B